MWGGHCGATNKSVSRLPLGAPTLCLSPCPLDPHRGQGDLTFVSPSLSPLLFLFAALVVWPATGACEQRDEWWRGRQRKGEAAMGERHASPSLGIFCVVDLIGLASHGVCRHRGDESEVHACGVRPCTNPIHHYAWRCWASFALRISLAWPAVSFRSVGGCLHRQAFGDGLLDEGGGMQSAEETGERRRKWFLATRRREVFSLMLCSNKLLY